MSTSKSLTRAALATALVLVAQFIGKIVPAGFVIFGPFSLNQLITGSLVNMILMVAAVKIGIGYGIAVGILSSILATILQIGPIFPIITPAIAIGNGIIVLVFGLIYRLDKKAHFYPAVGVVAGAAAKCAFLWLTVPMLLKLIPDILPAQTNMLTIMFSWPQGITGLVGGILALCILPVLNKAVHD